ncbi:MAG: DUF4270 domain-containing protein [Bacteroidales bacterium]|nr:DUF4270 domain-containing protein [Bacteroidales bacterium]MBD5247458.1 DUF4270 domain-containing protein [Barnesiella sp.]
MRLKYITIAASVCAAATLAGCGETDGIGSSLIQSDNDIVIEDNFTLTGHSVINDKVQSRTAMLLLGSIDADDYGHFESDFVTQFMPVAQLDTTLTSAAAIDSVKLKLMYAPGSFVGDSIMPMGLEVYRLTQGLKAPIFSDFNPADYYDASKPIGSAIYVTNNFELSDSLKALDHRDIYVDLPLDLGVELYNLYQSDPQSYLSPDAFAKHFPGIYVRNSYGSGRITQIGATQLQLYYHFDTKNSAGRDTTYNYVGSFYSATPEVLSNNNIEYALAPELNQRMQDGEQLIVAPAGLEVEMEFPLLDVVKYFRQNSGRLSVINNLTLSIPAVNIANTYGIRPPSQLLMVLKKDKDKFFEEGKVTDGITSFYATFSRSTESYDFSSLRDYLLDALEREDELTADDYTFILTPVAVDAETISDPYYGTSTVYVKAIVPYVQQPAMARLKLDEAKIQLTFTNQSVK